MIGCIRCHGPLDGAGECPICDAPVTPEDRIVDAILRRAGSKGWYHEGPDRMTLSEMLRGVKGELVDAVRVELILQRQN